jgi:hypothetical protein
MGQALNDFLVLVAQVLLVIALPIVIAGMVVWLRQRLGEVRSKLTQDHLSILEKAAALAVRAAEQSGISKQIAEGGKAKKDYALQVLQNYLNSHGINVDLSMIDSAIEAEVHKQFTVPQTVTGTPESKAALIDKAVQGAVWAAEQSGLTGTLVEAGKSLAEQKKQYALNLAQNYLAQYGIQADLSVIDGLIEVQVLRLNQGQSMSPEAPAAAMPAVTTTTASAPAA